MGRASVPRLPGRRCCWARRPVQGDHAPAWRSLRHLRRWAVRTRRGRPHSDSVTIDLAALVW